MILWNIGSRGVLSHHRFTAVAVAAVTVGVFGVAVVVRQPYRTYCAMAMTTTAPHLSDSIQQSLPQLYDTPLKRILDYTTDPITKSVTANIDTLDGTSSLPSTLRSVVVQHDIPLPSVCFVIRRPG